MCIQILIWRLLLHAYPIVKSTKQIELLLFPKFILVTRTETAILQYLHHKLLSDIYINLLLNTVQMLINKATFRKLNIYESHLSAISKQNSGTNKLKSHLYTVVWHKVEKFESQWTTSEIYESGNTDVSMLTWHPIQPGSRCVTVWFLIKMKQKALHTDVNVNTFTLGSLVPVYQHQWATFQQYSLLYDFFKLI
jgi:hypothetical protein